MLGQIGRVCGILAGLIFLGGGGVCVATNLSAIAATRVDAGIFWLLGFISLAVAVGGLRLIIEMLRQLNAKKTEDPEA
jgi:hypothetical protein